MGKKRKQRQSETMGHMAGSRKLAEQAYRGQGPSLAQKQMEQATGRLGTQMRGAYQSERSPFMRALAQRQGMRGASSMQAQSLGQLASARAQEQLGALGLAVGAGQQMGQARAAQKTGWEAIGAPIVGGIGGAASAFI